MQNIDFGEKVICGAALPENIRILSDISRKTVTVKADILGEKSGIAHLKIFDDKYYSEGNRKAQCLFAAFKLLGYSAGLVCKGY